MQVKNLKDAEVLQTPEGFMRPLVFGERLIAFYLEIPPHFKVEPHSHKSEGFLYCLSGELEVVSSKGKINVEPGTAILIPAGLEAGVENKKNDPVKAIIVSSPPMVKSTEQFKELLKQHGVQNKE